MALGARRPAGRCVVSAPRTVAALYVERGGAYYGVEGVDPWDIDRDARLYAGPHPVVAHPPCERWGKYWGGSPTTFPRLTKGDDGGCFAAALASVRQWGGVIEHPEASHAWRTFGLTAPPWGGGWVNADFQGGWTCCIEQGHYGHPARKPTWLYAFGVELPALRWGSSGQRQRLEAGYHSAEERRRALAAGGVAAKCLPHRQRAVTPPAFRDLLLAMARTARVRSEAA